jgi:uncharacterized membrane protein YeiB
VLFFSILFGFSLAMMGELAADEQATAEQAR